MSPFVFLRHMALNHPRIIHDSGFVYILKRPLKSRCTIVLMTHFSYL